MAEINDDTVLMSESKMLKALVRRRDRINGVLLTRDCSKEARSYFHAERDALIQLMARYQRLKEIAGEKCPYGQRVRSEAPLEPDVEVL